MKKHPSNVPECAIAQISTPVASSTAQNFLIDILRQIDAGLITPTRMVVAYQQDCPGEHFAVGSFRSNASFISAVGLLEVVKNDLLRASLECL